MLNTKLNLSSNVITQISEFAFFSIKDYFLRIEIIDLSNNMFNLIPWRSLKWLNRIKNIILDRNLFKTLNIGTQIHLNSVRLLSFRT